MLKVQQKKKSSGENKNTSNARITRITIIDNYKTIGIQLHLNELTYSKVRRTKSSCQDRFSN